MNKSVFYQANRSNNLIPDLNDTYGEDEMINVASPKARKEVSKKAGS